MAPSQRPLANAGDHEDLTEWGLYTWTTDGRAGSGGE